MDSSHFNYTEYIQNRLKELEDLDERKFAKEVLVENLEHIFTWTEQKYDALKQRIQKELTLPWENYSVYMTVVEKSDYDPIGTFWFPLCEEDISRKDGIGNPVVYLMAEDKLCQEFICQELTGTDQESGKEIRFHIREAKKYKNAVRKLYSLFLDNHIPWRTLHLGHIERFFELVPAEELPSGSRIRFDWGNWEEYVKPEMIPLWNIKKMSLSSREYRFPCIDRAVYEHIFYLEEGEDVPDGYLVEMDGEIISVRYEKERLLLKTESEALEDVSVYRLNQGKDREGYNYRYPVLANRAGMGFAARYLNQVGNFIQTPMELYRKIEELSGDYHIRLERCRIIEPGEERFLEGDMNGFAGEKIFLADKRKVLLFEIRREREKEDYLYESQVRYMLSQMQMEFLEYRCAGVFV